jgi:hypothetical protein
MFFLTLKCPAYPVVLRKTETPFFPDIREHFPLKALAERIYLKTQAV